MGNPWLKVTGILGTSAVALGAYGAHGLRGRSDSMRDVWRTASTYHFMHTLALAVGATQLTGRKRNITCSLFTGGILLFSGACYTVALMDERQPWSKIAPVGGFMLMGGWLALGFL